MKLNYLINIINNKTTYITNINVIKTHFNNKIIFSFKIMIKITKIKLTKIILINS